MHLLNLEVNTPHCYKDGVFPATARIDCSVNDRMTSNTETVSRQKSMSVQERCDIRGKHVTCTLECPLSHVNRACLKVA